MHTFTRSLYVATFVCMLMQACSDEQPIVIPNHTNDPQDTSGTVDTRGYWENGEIISTFDCPDSRFFPPVDIKYWDKVPVVNGRLPTYEETMNGTSIHTYKGNKHLHIKPFAITLPKLAYYVNGASQMKLNSSTNKMEPKQEPVIVIQMVQTPNDTLVGFRYLTGGVGGSSFRDFRFLSADEIKMEIEESIKAKHP